MSILGYFESFSFVYKIKIFITLSENSTLLCATVSTKNDLKHALLSHKKLIIYLTDAENSKPKISISYFLNFKLNYSLKLNLFHNAIVLFSHFEIYPTFKRRATFKWNSSWHNIKLFYSKITFVLHDSSLMLLTMYFSQSSDSCRFSFKVLVALTPYGQSKVPSLIQSDDTNVSSISSSSVNEIRLQLIL